MAVRHARYPFRKFPVGKKGEWGPQACRRDPWVTSGLTGLGRLNCRNWVDFSSLRSTASMKITGLGIFNLRRL